MRQESLSVEACEQNRHAPQVRPRIYRQASMRAAQALPVVVTLLVTVAGCSGSEESPQAEPVAQSTSAVVASSTPTTRVWPTIDAEEASEWSCFAHLADPARQGDSDYRADLVGLSVKKV